MEDKVIIRDEDCENVVLGTLLSKMNAFDECREYLDSDCFYFRKNQRIYEVIKILSDKGEPISTISVLAELNKDKDNDIDAYALVCIESNSDFLNYVLFAQRLKELCVRRNFYRIGQQLMTAGVCECEDIADVYVKTKDNLCLTMDSVTDSVISLDNSLGDWYSQMQEIKGLNGMIGTPTGFDRIDEEGGLQKGDLIIVAAETSQGKSAFALSLVLSAIQNKHPVIYYSLEMSRLQLTTRLIALSTDIPIKMLRGAAITDNILSQVDDRAITICGKPLYFDDRSTSNIETIISSIRSMKMKYNIRGAFIDYLQIATLNIKNVTNKEQQTAEIARRLKNLAKELGIWIVLLSQLNRNMENPEPKIHRLRDSGQIAEAADSVILIYRPEVYGRSYFGEYKNVSTEGTALINIAKGRNIGTFSFICGFNTNTTRFYQLNVLPQRGINRVDNEF